MEYIIGISVYLLSVYLMWRYIKECCSVGGINYGHDADLFDIVIIFVPALNTAVVIIGYLFFPPKGRKKIDYNKFFKIKK